MQVTGSTVSAAQALTLTAGNDLLLDAAESSDQRHFRKTTTQTQGLGRKAVANTLDTFSVRQTGTTLSAGHIDLTAGNDLTLIATAVAATGDIRFTAGAEIAYLAATQLDESHATRKKSDNLLGFANLSGLIDNGWQQAKAKRETTSSTRTGAVTVIQTPDAVLSQSAGDTTLAGTTIRAGRFTATAGLGANGEGGQANAQIHLLGIKESETLSQTKESGSFMWQSAKGEGRSTETLRLPDIQAYGASTAAPTIGPQGPVGDVPETERASELASLSPTLTAPGGITVGATDLPTTQAEANRATPGHAGNGTPPPTVKLDLKTQAETLARQPGLAWLGELAQRDDVDWQQIALIHDQWDYKHSGLTQEGGAVIAIVVAIVTWGWGSSAATTSTAIGSTGTTATTVGGMTLSTTTATGITYSALGTALNAGFTTLATQASVSLINNQGDIGQTLKDLGSSDSVKQLVTSMLTAGLTQSATEYLQGERLLVKDLNHATFTERFATYTTKAVVGASVQSVVMGHPLDETLQTALTNSLAQTLTSEIGDWGKGSETLVAKTLAHAVVQCAAARVQGGDCASAALGAATAELLSPLLDGLDERTREAGFQQTLGSAIAGLSAMLVAELTGQDALTAMNAAQRVDYYNRQLHPDERNLAKELASKSDGRYTEQEIADALRWASNADLNETASSNIVVQLKAETSADKVFDAQSLSLGNSGGQAVLYQDLSRITPPNSDLMAFIQQNTGGVYSWNTAAWQAMPQAIFTQDGTRYGVFSANGQSFKLPLADCPAAGCATSPIAWASTNQQDQAALQAYATATGVEMTSFVSRTAGIVSSTATTAAATPGPHQPVATGTAIVAQTVGLAADAVESYITRDSAKMLETAFITVTQQFVTDKALPLAAPITNEVIEAWKASETKQELDAWANQRWNEFLAKRRGE